MKLLQTLILCVGLLGTTQIQAQKFNLKSAAKALTGGSDLSKEDAAAGIKEALNEGIGEAVNHLAKENGYYDSVYKILVPKEAQTVIQKVKMIPGFEDVEDKLVRQMNLAAEKAVVKGGPIFADAVTSLTFDDAVEIVTGEEHAATNYLKTTTSDALFAAFEPEIIQALDEINAREYWNTVVVQYNKLPFVKKVNPDLERYVTEKAMDGIFGEIATKEADIRDNIDARTTELLRKVFGK